MSVLDWLWSILIGLLVGLASSFLGLGGGAFIVPLLPWATGVSARVAIGTSLFTVFLVAAQNASGFHQKRLVAWRAVATIGVFSAIASFAAGKLTNLIPEKGLKVAFAALILFLAWQSITGRGLKGLKPRELKEGESREASLYAYAALGIASGFISGFTGIGGGVFVVPILSLYAWVPQAMVVPTSVGTIAVTALSGFAAFATSGVKGANGLLSSVEQGAESVFSLGLVRIDLAIALFFGAILTSRLGIRYQSALSPRKRDWLVGILLLVLMAQILFTIFR